MDDHERRKPADLAGDGLSCAVLAERRELTQNLSSLQQLRELTPAQRLARERWVLRQIVARSGEIGRATCRQQASEYRAASIRLRAAATVERSPTSERLIALAESFDRRQAILAEAAR